jgi:L-asparaginase
MSIESFQSFESPNVPPLANIGLNVNINSRYILKEKTDVSLKPICSQDILSLGVYPGLKPDIYQRLITESVKAMVIEGFGSGNLPAEESGWIEFVSSAVDQDILVYLGSQSPHGLTDLSIYACGQRARDAGALSLHDMTTEAALVKLMLLLGNKFELSRVKQLMDKSLAGEVTKST